MAWTPISLIVPQYEDANGNPYSGAVLKAYAAGTSTPITMATTSAGSTTFTSIALNASGYPTHNGSIVIPHVQQSYKVALYANQAAADADTPAIWSIDNNAQIPVSGAFLTDDSVSSGVTNVITATHTTTGTPVAGIGTGIAYATETSADNNEIGMVIEAVTTDVTAGAESFDFVLKLMRAGAAAAQKFRVSSLGRVFGFTSFDWTRATVASHATTADIWSVGNQIDWTGTETTTIFPNAPQAGAERVLICAGACSFTAGANMLIDGVTSGNTVTCAANDEVTVKAVSTTQFKLWRKKYDGTAQVQPSNPVGSIFDYAGVTVPSGYLSCDGSIISRATYADLFAALTVSKGTFTVTIAAPGLITLASHGLETGDVFSATTTGALPTSFSASTNYWFIKNDADSGWFATSYANAFAGTKITTSGSQSGVHTLRHNPWGISGANDFLLPDLNRRTTIGIGGSATSTIGNTLGATGGAETHALSAAENGPHTHTLTNVGVSAGVEDSQGVYNNASEGTLVTDSSGSGTAHNNMQPSAVVRKIIKT